jgi:ATP adenylyltransferase
MARARRSGSGHPGTKSARSGGTGAEPPSHVGEVGGRSRQRAHAGKGQPRTARPGSRSRTAARPGSVEPRQPLRLWAPWRMELLESPKPEGCIFCQFFSQAGEESDRQNLVVHRAPRCFVMLNRYPYNSGHVMVVPRSHAANLEDLPDDEYGALHDELKAALRVLRRTYRPDGMNVGMNLGVIAGAGIAEHLHYHVVPRWAGDTSFMPIMADVRVMVQHLDDAWRRIHAGFDGV